MGMEFCIKAHQLRAALKRIEAAEANGFHYCEAVFQVTSCGRCLDECQATYSDLYEKAHPTDANLDWGRGQGVTQRNKFIDGTVVPLE